MASTNFIARQTVIEADWLNDVNNFVYDNGHTFTDAQDDEVFANPQQFANTRVRVGTYAKFRASVVSPTKIEVIGRGIEGTFLADPTNTSGAWFTGSISGTTLTVTAITNGSILVNHAINDATGATVAYVQALGTGTGGVGTYTLSASVTRASQVMSADDGGYTLVRVTDGLRYTRAAPSLRPEFFSAFDDARSFAAAADQYWQLQAWLTTAARTSVRISTPGLVRAKSLTKLVYAPSGTLFGGNGADMGNLVLAIGSANAGITIGNVSSGTVFDGLVTPTVYRSPAVWSATAGVGGAQEDDYAVQIINATSSKIYTRPVAGTTIGMCYHSQNVGFAYCEIYSGPTTDCKFGEVLRTRAGTVLNGEFLNEVKFFGGRRGRSSSTNGFGRSYGTFLTWDKISSYRGANQLIWYSPCYEALNSTPIYLDGVGGGNLWHMPRFEFFDGPMMVADAQGNSNFATGNIIEHSFTGSSVGDFTILQVNGAFGNIRKDPRRDFAVWQSGPMRDLVKSGGTALTAFVKAPYFTKHSGSPLPRRVTNTTGFLSNARCLQVYSPIAVEVDTTAVKTFRIDVTATASNRNGRIFVQCFDASGSVLFGNAPAGPDWGAEPYLKNLPVHLAQNAAFGGYWVAQADGVSAVTFTVRDEVQFVHIGVAGGTNPALLESIKITGYPDIEFGRESFPINNPLRDDGAIPIASANPSSVGVHGYYARGEILLLSNSTGWSNAGVVTTTEGYLARAWLANTSYQQLGEIASNDSGKMYELMTVGTSAASGGPTGTGTGIVDGTCVWNYVGVRAVLA